MSLKVVERHHNLDQLKLGALCHAAGLVRAFAVEQRQIREGRDP
jgi:hypothetical protein